MSETTLISVCAGMRICVRGFTESSTAFSRNLRSVVAVATIWRVERRIKQNNCSSKRSDVWDFEEATERGNLSEPLFTTYIRRSLLLFV